MECGCTEISLVEYLDAKTMIVFCSISRLSVERYVAFR
jgi:hypothetical protein